VRPFTRDVRLLPDGVTMADLDTADLLPVPGGRAPTIRLEPPPVQPRLVDDVVVLTVAPARTPTGERTGLQPVNGVERVALLRGHTDRDGLAPLVLGRSGWFDRLTQLAGAVRVRELVRPAGGGTLDEVVAAIEGLTSASIRA
jgi:hypothetical protein